MILLLVACLGGCAGTRVNDLASNRPVNLQPPRTVALKVEDDSPWPRRATRIDAHLAAAKAAEDGLSAALPKLLASRHLIIVRQGYPADLTLLCRIVAVRRGNEALRVLVGYGAGKAVLRVRVALTDTRNASASPLLSFETSSTTGEMGGAGLGVASGLSSGNAVGAIGPALGVPGVMKQGLPQEVTQTVGQIDEQLAKYYKSENWPYPKPAKSFWNRI